METCIKKLFIDTSSLADTAAVYEKLYPIVSKRIHDRCNTVCMHTAGDADFVLRFALDPEMPTESFRLTDMTACKGF